MKLVVAVPFYCEPSEQTERELYLAVEMIHAATSAPVHVFYAPGRPPSLPDAVAAHAAAPLPEPDSMLPRGWFTAVTTLSSLFPGSAVLVVNPWNPRLSAQRVSQAVEEMTGTRPEALLSMMRCTDHPCQWEEYFDIVESQAFTPVDRDDGGIGELVSRELGTDMRAQVSIPFVMPSTGPWPREGWKKRVFEWLPEEGILRSEPSIGDAPHASLEQRVFLWHEGGAMVRQAAFCARELAALPLFRPVGQAGLCFLRNESLWNMCLSRECAATERFQLFALPNHAGTRDVSGALALHPARPGQEEQVGGGFFLNAATMPPQSDSPVFLVNALVPASLPQADISLPYHSAYGGWIIDPLTMMPQDRLTGDPIRGRQYFPEVLELEGSLLGLSAEAASTPLAALLEASRVHPLILDETEVAPHGDPPPQPPKSISVRRAPKPRPAPGQVDALLDGLRQLRGEIEKAQSARKEDSGPGRNLPRLGRAMELLTEVRSGHAALVLERDTVVRQIKEFDERLIDLRPVSIFLDHRAKALHRVPEDIESVLSPHMEALLGMWADCPECESLTAERALSALARMRGYATEHGLHPCWASGLPLILAGKGLYQEALDILREAYSLKPWMQDEHARIAVTCFRSQFRFEEYLSWMERDALPGRMSPPWLFHYCEALAVCRREVEAERLADEAYGRHPTMANLYATIASWRYCQRDFLPAKALRGFEKDAAAGRLDSAFATLHVAMLAAVGQLDRACGLVEEIYARDTSATDGFAAVGWYGHLVNRRDPEEAIALFERDASLGRLHPLWKCNLAAVYAFKGDMDTAVEMVEKVYADFPLLDGWIAQLGLTQWLRSRDTGVVLWCFERDMELGRLNSVELRLIYHAMLSLAGRDGAEGLLERTPPTDMIWDLSVARLGRLGYKQGDVDELMTRNLRNRLFSMD